MNCAMRKVSLIVASLAGLVIAALVLPMAVSAMCLNAANARAAYAASLPSDSPARVSALAEAEARLARARDAANLSRLALADARIELARGEPARAAAALRASDASLRGDPIAQFTWANAEWQVANASAAFEHWRAAGAIEFFIQEANRARDRHQWQAMERSARIAIHLAPERADAHYALADALGHLAPESAETLAELERARALTRDPEFLSTVLSRQGEVLAAQGKFQEALALFEQAMDVAPRDARPRTDYARTLLQFRPAERERAEGMLRDSIALAPWDVAAFAALAEIAESRGDAAGAAEWFRLGLEKNSNHPLLLFELGKFYARQGWLAQARQTLTLALRYETRADNLQAIARALAELPSQ